MKLLEKILIPIDFRKSTDSTIEAATSIAKKYDSTVILASVLPDENIDKFQSMLEGFACDKLYLIKSKLENNGVSIEEPIVKFGHKLELITKIARTENVNLILVSSDCYEDDGDKLSQFVEKLTRKCEKPIWTIKQNQAFNIDKILCPVDFSNASERALKNAIQLARKYQAGLTILNVFEPMTSLFEWIDTDLNEENQKGKQEAENKMNRFLTKFSFTDLSYEKVIGIGKPTKYILNIIKESNFDLLVIGTNGRTGIGKIIIGSTTEKIIRELPCSFIATKSTDIINLKLENEIKDIEEHLKIANKLEENGYFEEAIRQYEICLGINSMHIPSHFSIANIYKKLNKEDKASYYEKMALELMDRIWDKKIEHEIRKYYSKS